MPRRDLVSTTEAGLRAVQRNLGMGCVEITLHKADELVAIVSHPFARAPWWFLHRASGAPHLKERFRTRKAAFEAAALPPPASAPKPP